MKIGNKAGLIDDKISEIGILTDNNRNIFKKFSEIYYINKHLTKNLSVYITK